MGCPHTQETQSIEEHECVIDDFNGCGWEGEVDVIDCPCLTDGLWTCPNCGRDNDRSGSQYV